MDERKDNRIYERADDVPLFSMEESQELLSAPIKMKRKVRSKKMDFVGWGSKPLIEFLEFIGKDTRKQFSQFEVTAIVNEYINRNSLIHPQKKKRILCDERLHSLFGKKSVVRIKIYDLLETHFAENQDELEDEFLYSSEENGENTRMVGKKQKASSSDRKNLHQRKKVHETPKSCFAAIIPTNIKLLHLKRSLLQDLLKDAETFESKVVGSFVRVKSDPNDYSQRYSHQLLQVTGVSKASGTENICSDVTLQVSEMPKDIPISMLSDDNFSEEECEDLHQRVKGGSLKRPTVVEFQQKAQMLHEDVTKHWLGRELTLLQNLIDRSNEKGWRKELFEYLERKQLLQTPAEQSRLLLEVPKVIADELDQESTLKEESDNSPRSFLKGASEISTGDLEATQTLSVQNFGSTDAADNQLTDVHQKKIQPTIMAEFRDPQGRNDEQVVAPQVIEVSDDDKEDEDPGGRHQTVGNHLGRSIWHYVDPQGAVQGPFTAELLKHWSDSNYFPANFKVWKIGQSLEDAVYLSDLLLQIFQG